MVLGGDVGSVMQPHIPDLLDPRGSGLSRAHSSESAVDLVSAQFLAQESRECARREDHPSVRWDQGGPHAALVPSRVGTDVQNPLQSV
jgi:hypothetical protein